MSGNYDELEVWGIAMELAEAVYRATDSLPRTERFGLSAQIRRSAVSIVSNVAEGRGRRSVKEFKRFADIACGSLFELETQLALCERLGYISEQEIRATADLTSRTSRMLNGLRRSLLLQEAAQRPWTRRQPSAVQ